MSETLKNVLQRILVTGANGDIANAIGRGLREAFPKAQLIGGDLGDAWPGLSVFDKMITLPRADHPDYLQALRAAASDSDAQLIIPATEPELRCLAQNEDRVKDLPLLMNAPEVVARFLDKLETARWLEGIGLEVPKTQHLIEATAVDLPVMVKPRSGSGSRGLEIVTTPARLALCQQEREADTIAQQLLDPHDGEFTCAVFRHGDEVRTLIMRRWLSGGLTGRMVVEENAPLDAMLHKIARALPETAAINVQLREVGGRHMIFEINPRLSSTTMMRARVGFQDLVWWIAAKTEGTPPPAYAPVAGTRVYRAYGEVVVNADA